MTPGIWNNASCNSNTKVLYNKQTQTFHDSGTKESGTSTSEPRNKLPLPRDVDGVDKGGSIRVFDFCQVIQDSRSKHNITIVRERITEEVHNHSSDSEAEDRSAKKYRYCKEVIKPYLKSFPADCSEFDEELLKRVITSAEEDFPDQQPCFSFDEFKNTDTQDTGTNSKSSTSKKDSDSNCSQSSKTSKSSGSCTQTGKKTNPKNMPTCTPKKPIPDNVKDLNKTQDDTKQPPCKVKNETKRTCESSKDKSKSDIKKPCVASNDCNECQSCGLFDEVCKCEPCNNHNGYEKIDPYNIVKCNNENPCATDQDNSERETCGRSNNKSKYEIKYPCISSKESHRCEIHRSSKEKSKSEIIKCETNPSDVTICGTKDPCESLKDKNNKDTENICSKPKDTDTCAAKSPRELSKDKSKSKCSKCEIIDPCKLSKCETKDLCEKEKNKSDIKIICDMLKEKLKHKNSSIICEAKDTCELSKDECKSNCNKCEIKNPSKYKIKNDISTCETKVKIKNACSKCGKGTWELPQSQTKDLSEKEKNKSEIKIICDMLKEKLKHKNSSITCEAKDTCELSKDECKSDCNKCEIKKSSSSKYKIKNDFSKCETKDPRGLPECKSKNVCSKCGKDTWELPQFEKKDLCEKEKNKSDIKVTCDMLKESLRPEDTNTCEAKDSCELFKNKIKNESCKSETNDPCELPKGKSESSKCNNSSKVLKENIPCAIKCNESTDSNKCESKYSKENKMKSNTTSCEKSCKSDSLCNKSNSDITESRCELSILRIISSKFSPASEGSSRFSVVKSDSECEPKMCKSDKKPKCKKFREEVHSPLRVCPPEPSTKCSEFKVKPENKSESPCIKSHLLKPEFALSPNERNIDKSKSSKTNIAKNSEPCFKDPESDREKEVKKKDSNNDLNKCPGKSSNDNLKRKSNTECTKKNEPCNDIPSPERVFTAIKSKVCPRDSCLPTSEEIELAKKKFLQNHEKTMATLLTVAEEMICKVAQKTKEVVEDPDAIEKAKKNAGVIISEVKKKTKDLCDISTSSAEKTCDEVYNKAKDICKSTRNAVNDLKCESKKILGLDGESNKKSKNCCKPRPVGGKLPCYEKEDVSDNEPSVFSSCLSSVTQHFSGYKVEIEDKSSRYDKPTPRSTPSDVSLVNDPLPINTGMFSHIKEKIFSIFYDSRLPELSGDLDSNSSENDYYLAEKYSKEDSDDDEYN